MYKKNKAKKQSSKKTRDFICCFDWKKDEHVYFDKPVYDKFVHIYGKWHKLNICTLGQRSKLIKYINRMMMSRKEKE